MPAAPDLTIREAAELAGVTKVTIEKAVEAKVIRTYAGPARLRGGATRFVPLKAVAYFAALHRANLGDLPKHLKKSLWTKLARLEPMVLEPIEFSRGAYLHVGDLAAGPFEAAANYKAARDAHIVSDGDILGGTPVISGTRITVYSVLARLQGGETIDDLCEDNPDIPREAFEAAALFAKAHPMRGRPSGRPWRNAA